MSRWEAAGQRASAKVRVRRGDACVGLLLWTAACAPPSVDAVVAWVEGRGDGEGRQELRVYDAGQRIAAQLRPVIPLGEDQESLEEANEVLALEVDSRGQGVAVSGQETYFYDLRDGRQPVLSSLGAGGGRLASQFRFVRNGDAILRGFEQQSASAVVLMPTTSVQAGMLTVVQTPAALRGGTWQLAQASDAPILAWVERSGSPSSPNGRVEILGYPSVYPGPLRSEAVISDVARLAAGSIDGVPITLTQSASRISDGWCLDRACIAPGGGSLTAPTSTACRVKWWDWIDAGGREDVVATEIELGEGCPRASNPLLFAQIEHDVVLLDDERRIYVADLTTGAVRAGPKVWGIPLESSAAPSVRMADRGHAAVVISTDARVVRADADGVEVISAQAAPCPTAVAAIVSPAGRWTLATCNGDGTFVPSDLGSVYRISPLGFEVFGGISMRPLAIDDDGNGLLYSFDPDDGQPRGLFVLTADGELSRIDDLEPEPGRVRDGQLIAQWFAVGILRP